MILALWFDLARRMLALHQSIKISLTSPLMVISRTQALKMPKGTTKINQAVFRTFT
jgi:hypothetical protein